MEGRSTPALTDPLDGASISFFRVAFGVILAVEICRYFALGWIERDFIQPEFHFAYFGLEGLRPWPEPWIQVHFALLLLLSLGIAFGGRQRLCAALFALGFGLANLWDKSTYQNHNYLVFLFAILLALVPATIRPSGVPRWGLYLFRFQVAVPYVFGGIAKLGGDWLAGAPMGMWLTQRMDFPVLGKYFEEPWLVGIFVWGGLVFDLAIVPLLLWRRTRVAAFIGAVLFHLVNHRLFQIGIFPWFMIAGTTLFFAPSWPRRAFERLGRSLPSVGDTAQPIRSWQRFVVVAWIVLQVALPLRHWLYPGRVDWTEEGHRFAWHMKLRDKQARIHSITLHDLRNGESGGVDPRDHLTNRQITEMCMHPVMIRQFALHVADKARAHGIQPEIRADIRVSLNGAPFVPLIDPELDLVAFPARLTEH